MMSLTFGLFTQVSGSGPLGPLVCKEMQSKLSGLNTDGSFTMAILNLFLSP